MTIKSKDDRVETGVIQFGDDCPGVFLRGDHAAYYVLMLKDVLAKLNNEKSMASFTLEMLALHISNLINILGACNISDDAKIKYLKTLDGCLS